MDKKIVNLVSDGNFNAKELGKDILVCCAAVATLSLCRKFTADKVCNRLMGAAYQDIDSFRCLLDAYADKVGYQKLIKEGRKFWDATK